MNVLLTGASGYLGEHVARALRAAGHTVVALVRRPGQAAELEAMGIEARPGDMERPDSWTRALAGCEALVHCAGLVHSFGHNREAFTRVNVDGTLALVDRARAAGMARIVVTSSLFALGPARAGALRDESAADEPPSPLHSANDYVRTKALASAKLRAMQREGHPVVVVYPTVLLGPGRRTRGNHTARVLADVAAGRLPGLVGDGEQVWNLVPVADAARGHVLALERGRPGEGYILGGENWTQRQLVERAALLFGVKPPLRRLGRAVPLAVGAMAELWARLSGKEPFLTLGEVRLYDAHWAVSCEKARVELGYEAGDVETTLAHTVDWLRAEEERA